MILLNADVREAAAKMFAVPERLGDAEALEVELGVVVVFLLQAPASIVKQATATMQRFVLEILMRFPPHVGRKRHPLAPSLNPESIGPTASEQAARGAPPSGVPGAGPNGRY